MREMADRRQSENVTDNFEISLNMPKSYPEIKARPTAEGGVRDRFFAAVAELPDEITVVRPFCPDAFEKSNRNTFYVSPDGSDGATGKADDPIRTIKEAFDRVRGLGGAKIVLRGGDYDLTETLQLGPDHSGTAESPLVVTVEKGEKARVSTSKKIPASAFSHDAGDAFLLKFKPEVRDRVVCTDLPSLGITDLGSVSAPRKHHGNAWGSALVFNGRILDLARYPNAGETPFHTTGKIWSTGFDEEGNERPWEMEIDDDRVYAWADDDEIYVYGALTYDWIIMRGKVAGFDKEKRTVIGEKPFAGDAIIGSPDNDFCFTNVPEELDAPGEWYLDRKTGKLYLIPPYGELKDEDDIRFVTGHCDVLTVRGAKYVLIDGLDIGRCGGAAINVFECENVVVQRCLVTGTCAHADDDDSAVAVEDCKRCGFISSRIEEFSNKALSLSGGDRKTLTPGNNFIQNNVVINGKNRFGIMCGGGVGNVVSHNYLENATMGDAGQNEGIFEYNVIKGGDTVAHDTGMIYVGGGGCSSCGNHYRYNYFHDFAKGDYGIYFDDLSRGMYAYGNVVVGNGTEGDGTVWRSGGRSYNHHNGGEHCFWNNVSIDAGFFAFGGDISYWVTNFNHWKSFFEGIYGAAVEMSVDVYLKRNPTFREWAAAAIQHHEDLKDPNYVEKSGKAERRLRTPWCNHYENNVIVRAARPFKLDNGLESATGLGTNFITEEDPGFVDFEGRDYRIRPDAPLYKKIPDFKPIPFEKMGPTDN
ncbi:MAG: right-handed parallel beta-helix repeat-containing protein [Clostridia bacterium]|nr:right-handed parallel beta-helix repeat-containing protein [Clostridia bacterium]